MKFHEAAVQGAWLIELEPIEDERGAFTRTFDAAEFVDRGLNAEVAQCSASFNRVRGTLRGLHYQADPHGECKLIRCTRGAIFDVLVDLRAASPTFRRWFGVELTAENGRMVYVPAGIAHGLLTLVDSTEVAYQISTPYVPDAARGVRWDDPAFDIDWPAEIAVISERDRTFADFRT